MSVRIAATDRAHKTSADAEVLARSFRSPGPHANQPDHLRLKRLQLWVSTLPSAVTRIVGAGPEEQVRRIHTDRIVATVTDEQAIWNQLARVPDERHTMREVQLPTDCKAPVVVEPIRSVVSTEPRPTLVIALPCELLVESGDHRVSQNIERYRPLSIHIRYYIIAPLLRGIFLVAYSLVGKVDIVTPGWKCDRCGHQWIPRNAETPMVCPKCKSAYWNTPRRQPKDKKT